MTMSSYVADPPQLTTTDTDDSQTLHDALKPHTRRRQGAGSGALHQRLSVAHSALLLAAIRANELASFGNDALVIDRHAAFFAKLLPSGHANHTHFVFRSVRSRSPCSIAVVRKQAADVLRERQRRPAQLIRTKYIDSVIEALLQHSYDHKLALDVNTDANSSSESVPDCCSQLTDVINNAGRIVVESDVPVAGTPDSESKIASCDCTQSTTTSSDSKSIQQVVLLGAGLDCRAFRLDCLESACVFELDRPEVIQCKERMEKELHASDTKSSLDAQLWFQPKCRALVRIAADLCDDTWPTLLAEHGMFDRTAPTLWVIEGVVMYFNRQQVVHLLRVIASLSCLGSFLIADTVNAAMASSKLSWYRLFKWGCRDNKLTQFLFENYWNTIAQRTIGHDDLSFGRYTAGPELEQMPRSRKVRVLAHNVVVCSVRETNKAGIV
jgi:methyltransferase (TIGR00027 family)